MEKNNHSLFARLLPHLSLWLTISLVVTLFTVSVDDFMSYYGATENFLTIIVGLIPLFSLLAIFYWTAQKLQAYTVKPLTQPRSERSDSIQSDITDFIDVHNHSARLVGSINRSDAGVFGVTGVRGAGKSALTRHVLAQLKARYFVMEITAPIRHDTDLGFFISVCRSVCRKTLDDLGNILQGKQSGDSAQLKRRIRNGLLMVLLVVAGISSIWNLVPTATVNKFVTEAIWGSNQHPIYGQDPLLEEKTNDLVPHLIVKTERHVIDSLLAQIDAVLGEQNGAEQKLEQSTRYLLLPLPNEAGFFLALDQEPTNAKTYLSLFNSKPNPYWLDVKQFLRIDDQIGLLFCPFDENGNRPLVDSNLIDFGGLRLRINLYDPTIDSNYCEGSVFYSSAFFQEDIDYILNLSSIKLPLAQLNGEIRQHLFTQQSNKNLLPKRKPDIQHDKSRQNDSSCKVFESSKTKLISQQILEAFCYQDIKLSFDIERLEQFRQLLGIYRQLLDGERITNLLSSSAAAESKTASVPDFLNFQSRSSQVFWSTIALVIILLSTGPISRGFISLFRAMLNRRYLNLYQESEKFIELLSYTSTQQDSRSFGFKGISLGRTNTHAARDLTLPSLTAHYLEFIELIREQYNGKVIIVIDELDKIHDPDQVKKLLSEIKGALFSKGCFYLISISEDAARSFRYRLTSGRDIFESTFDEIIEIPQMDVQSGSAMLDKRAKNIDTSDKLPQPCLELLVLFGGGIPREIIRGSRTLSLKMDTMSEPAFSWAARQLLHEEISNWISHFGETNLNGEETVKLRDCAQLALAQFNGLEKTKKPDYFEVSSHLQSCLKIIDPDNLRNSVGFVDNAKEKDDSHALKYQALVSDIQACIRLIILAAIAELTEKTGNDWKQYDSAILNCHHALADKPALTEALLKELRSKHGLVEDV